MHCTDVGNMMVGQRERRIPLDGVNAFVRTAHELETGNNIMLALRKRYGESVDDIKIIGLANPVTDEEIAQHKRASFVWVARAIEWRTKFTSACDKKRQDVANVFPFMPKMPVYHHVQQGDVDDSDDEEIQEQQVDDGVQLQQRGQHRELQQRDQDRDFDDGRTDSDESQDDLPAPEEAAIAQVQRPPRMYYRNKFGYIEGVVTLELFQVWHALTCSDLLWHVLTCSGMF
jgi:hypothetical protein